ncbi:MAG: nodulation protein NfeD [Fibrobacter sp.]|nr:nodulation protein NfeD [Fibrobacter sp.]
MKRKNCIFFIILLLILSLNIKSITCYSQNPQVYVIEINNEIDMGLATFVERGIREALDNGAGAVVITIDTFGGLVAAATRIKDAILASSLPVITYVDGRALSAGALIALAGENLVMAPGSTIGGAEPIPDTEKNISALRGEFKSIAEERGKNSEIASAMVDKDIFIEGIIEEGKLLTLSSSEALKYGIADKVTNSLADVLAEYDLANAKIYRVKAKTIENFARLVTHPIVSGILLTLGFLGLFIEITTPGWGIPGTLGILALGSFFSGYLLTGIGSIGIVLLFFVGLFLLALEIFVVPGFGITGIGGILAILASLFLIFPSFEIAFQVVSGTFLATFALGLLLLKFLPRSPLWRKISLPTEEKLVEPTFSFKYGGLLKKEGITLTPLRPVGTIEVGGRRYDAKSESSYLVKGASIQVIRIEGNTIIVQESKDNNN